MVLNLVQVNGPAKSTQGGPAGRAIDAQRNLR
jgi:hypothetical protein